MRRFLLFSCVCVASCQLGTQATSRRYACDTSDDCAPGNLCFANVCITRDEFFAIAADAGRDAGPGGGSGGGFVETGGGGGSAVTDGGPDGGAPDGGAADAGSADAGAGDAGAGDAGAADAGAADAGAADAGAADAGTPDAGTPDGGCDAGTGFELCSDGLDNNCNGLVDCAELSCAMMACGLNGRVCTGLICVCGGGEASELTCNDTRDNDCDGLVDCADTTCGGRACGANGRTCSGTSCTCSGNGGTAQTNESTCNDTRDNDCDGLTDCADSQCNGQACGANGRTCSGTSCTCSGNGGAAQATETSCSDGFDNDCDGLVDSADSSCPVTPDAGSGMDAGVTYAVGPSMQPFVDACAQAGMTRHMFTDADDETTPLLTMPIAFSFYGTPVTQYWASTNSMVGFSSNRSATTSSACLPSSSNPRPGLFVALHDTITTNGICTAVTGAAPNRKLVITWPNMDHFDYGPASMTYSAILSEGTGIIDVVFSTMTGTANARGVDALTGVQSASASSFTQYQCHVSGYLTSGLAIRFTPQ